MSANRLKLNADKTELMWAGTKYIVASFLHDRDLTLTIGTHTVTVADAVRVLGVLFTPALALERHATSDSANCFYQLRQLRHVRRSLDRDSATMLVQTFVTSRIDYGNSLFANAQKMWTNKLPRVENAAARVIGGTRKFDRGLTRFLHHDLHWLDVPQRITFKLCLLVFKCLHGFAPQYFAANFCRAVCIGCRRHRAPQSALRHSRTISLNCLRYDMKNCGRRAFSYAGPHAWNSLPEHLRQTTSIDLIKRSLKTFLFGQISRPAH